MLSWICKFLSERAFSLFSRREICWFRVLMWSFENYVWLPSELWPEEEIIVEIWGLEIELLFDPILKFLTEELILGRNFGWELAFPPKFHEVWDWVVLITNLHLSIELFWPWYISLGDSKSLINFLFKSLLSSEITIFDFNFGIYF